MGSAGIKSIVASVLIAGAGLSLYLHFRPTPPTVDPRPQQALGQVLATEAGKLLGAGGRVTIVARDTSVFSNPASDFQMRGFLAAVKKAQLPLGATNWMQLDPLRIVRVPPGDYLDILRRQKEGDVVVCFLGPPLLNADQRARLGDKKVRVVALCSGAMPRQANLRELFDQGLLHAAAISQPNPPSTLPASDDAQAWFQQMYVLITAANLAELPTPLRTLAR